MATHLKKVRIDELSGVDEAANDTRGWIMQKAKGNLKAAMEAMEKSVVSTFEGLTAEETQAYLADAPNEVKDAHELLTKHIGNDLEDDEADAEPSKDEPETPTRKSIKETLQGIFGPVSKDSAPAETPEEPAEDPNAPPSAETPVEDPPEEPADPAANPDAEPPAEEPPASDVTQEADQPSELAATGEPAGEAEAVQAPDGQEDEQSDLVKSLSSVFEEQLAPMREAVVALADRTESLEKRSAGRAGLTGQDLMDEPTEGVQEGGLSKALRVAAKSPGHTVELT